jgi:arylsulfatase
VRGAAVAALGEARGLTAALRITLAAVLLSSAACTGVDTGPRAIVLISLDTLRADYVNSYGYRRFETTPVLDSLAAEGVLFESCIVVEPWTLTSHMSLFTGLRPARHGVGQMTVLPEGISTLAGLLRERGYQTQAFVDGGYMRSRWGFDRGFDGYEEAEFEGFQRLLPAALEWVEEHGEEPFFLFLHTYDVHNRGFLPDYRSPPPHRGSLSAGIESRLRTATHEEFRERFRELAGSLSETDKEYVRATYAEGVRFADAQLGELFRALSDLGLWERALIVVWSDHGEGLWDHEEWVHGEVYDHTIRVPLIMRLPGGEGAGRRVRTVVSAMDVGPTLLELAGAPIPPGLDGRSLVPLLVRDEGGGHAFSVLQSHMDQARSTQELHSVRTATHHYARNATTGEAYFFDLRDDPREQSNLHPSGTPLERELHDRLRGWLAEFPASRGTAIRTPLDPETRRQLRGLGYVE